MKSNTENNELEKGKDIKEEKTKKNSHRSLFVLLVCFVLAICLVLTYLFDPFRWFHPSIIDNPDSQNDPIIVTDPDDPATDPKDDSYSSNRHWKKGTEKKNAYEFIMETMNAPQYWGPDDMPPYAMPEDEALNLPKLVNATGWSLSDENTASFIRGAESTLEIDFSKYFARCDQRGHYCNFEKVQTYDFKNWSFLSYRFGDETSYDKIIERTYYDDAYIQEMVNHHYAYDDIYEIQKTFEYYEELFAFAGCPLLNQPEGTLASYKDKTITVPIKVDDGLIHHVWDQENFHFDYVTENVNEMQWLSDYRDILNKDVPESGLKESWVMLPEEGYDFIQVSNASPLYLAFINPPRGRWYLGHKGYWDPLTAEFELIMGSFALYCLQPATEQLFGYSTVYFANRAQVDIDYEKEYTLSSTMTKDEFLHNCTLSKSNTDCFLEFDLYGDESHFIRNKYDMAPDHFTLNIAINLLRSYFEYWNKPFPFADEYITSFILYYDMDTARDLGLR